LKCSNQEIKKNDEPKENTTATFSLPVESFERFNEKKMKFRNPKITN